MQSTLFMEDLKTHLKDISEIRTMMERSTKFISLSGLSGVSAGICALIGAGFAWSWLSARGWESGEPFHAGEYLYAMRGVEWDFVKFFVLNAGLTLVASLGLAMLFSVRLAKKRNLPIWNKTALNLGISIMIPLVAGGLLCLIQLWHGVYGWVASTTLIFYAMALLNASKFTLPEIRWLGISELVLGLACALMPGYGLHFWALGFGLLHILYGIIMYVRYER